MVVAWPLLFAVLNIHVPQVQPLSRAALADPTPTPAPKILLCWTRVVARRGRTLHLPTAAAGGHLPPAMLRAFCRIVELPPDPEEEPTAPEPVATPLAAAELSSEEQLVAAKDYLAALRGLDLPPAAQDERHALEQAWRLGQALDTLKRESGHGRWLAFLAARLPQLSHQNASRYLLFFRANPGPGSGGVQSPPASFRAESIRRLRWNYVPAKERPPGTSLAHRGFVAAFQRWERRQESGKLGSQSATVETLREDCGPVILRLAELLGREYVHGLLALPTKEEEAHE